MLQDLEQGLPRRRQAGRARSAPSLRAHLRYPEDLFKVQRDILSRYHVTDPHAFYSGQDFWNVPNDPTRATRNIKQPPYYLTTTMPGSEPDVLADHDVRARQGPNLAAFMAVDSTAGTRTTASSASCACRPTPRSPVRARRRTPSRAGSPASSTCCGVGASTVRYGNLLTLPFAGGLVYIEPVYIQVAAGGGQEPYPILQRVLVSFGSKIGVGRTLEGALEQVFGGEQQTQPQTRDAQQANKPAETNQATTALSTAISEAEKAYDDAQKALQTDPPNWNAYGKAQKRLDDALEKLKTAGAQPVPSASPSPTPGPRRSATPSATPPATPTGSPGAVADGGLGPVEFA